MQYETLFHPRTVLCRLLTLCGLSTTLTCSRDFHGMSSTLPRFHSVRIFRGDVRRTYSSKVPGASGFQTATDRRARQTQSWPLSCKRFLDLGNRARAGVRQGHPGNIQVKSSGEAPSMQLSCNASNRDKLASISIGLTPLQQASKHYCALATNRFSPPFPVLPHPQRSRA